MFTSLPFPVRYVPPAKGKSWVILIHGIGMTEKSWTDPYAEILAGGLLPFDYVLTDLVHPPDSFGLNHTVFPGLCPSTPLRLIPSHPIPYWDVLSQSGFGPVTWSQRDPLGPLAAAVEELKSIIDRVSPADGVVLLGHSRGGLIARKFLQERAPGWEKVKGVILLAAPNRGSRIAAFTRLPAQALLLPRFNRRGSSANQGRGGRVLRQILGYLQAFLEKPAIQELCPDSPLMKEMQSWEEAEARCGIPCYNFAGISTTYLRLYQIQSREPLRTVQAFSLFDGLENFFWGFWPPELQQGRGDGLVSAESASLPFARENRRVSINHAQFLIDADVRERVLDILKESVQSGSECRGGVTPPKG